MPDIETYRAVLPSLLTTHGMLVGISSPYRRIGLLYQKHKKFFGTDSADTLVVAGATTVFNQTVTEDDLVAMRAADPKSAKSEWDAEFRDDLSSFLDDALIDAAIDYARPLELPPQSGIRYRAFVDASGGAIGGDAYAIAIGHKQQGRIVIDVVRGRSGPFEPVEVTKEFAALCKEYGLHSVTGDSYAKEWVAGSWSRDGGLYYTKADKTASELYLEALPAFTRSLISLPNHPTLIRELQLLERIPRPSGDETVTHPRNAHDDLSNVVCGVCRLLTQYGGYDIFGPWTDSEGASPRLPDQPYGERRHIPATMTAAEYARICSPIYPGMNAKDFR